MKCVFSAAFAAIVTFGLAASSFAAPGLTSVTAEGTIGSSLEITGTELGTAAPKAFLRLAGNPTAKPFPLKLAKPFDGSMIHATVVKIEPGVYDLVVTPKGGTALTLTGAFTARAPQFSSFSSNSVATGATVDINGSFFGTKKGRVTVGDITAKVKSWTDGKITIIVSKKNRSGTFTVDLFGKGGTSDDVGSLDLVAPLPGKDNFVLTFDNGEAKFSGNTGLLATENAGGYQLNGTVRAGATNRIFQLTFAGKTLGTPFTVPVIAAYTGVKNFLPFIYSAGGNWTITISQRAGNRITGTISGSLTKQAGGGAATLNVTGTFTLTIL